MASIKWAERQNAAAQDELAAVYQDGRAAGKAEAEATTDAAQERAFGAQKAELRRAQKRNDDLVKALDTVFLAAELGRQHIGFTLASVKENRPADLANVPSAWPGGQPDGELARVLASQRALVEEACEAVRAAARAVESRVQPQLRDLTEQSDAGLLMASLAPRLHHLIGQATFALDGAERSTDDPILQAPLFRTEHLLIRLAREIERMQCLAGHTPTSGTPPMTVAAVLRRAASECEHYQRIRVPPPEFEVAVHGWVSPVVVHALSALGDNATALSSQEVVFQAFQRGKALVLEVLDRGLGVSPELLPKVQAVLADPERAPLRELVREGRIGLLVAALLGAKHGIRLVVEPREDGMGTRAAVIIPASCLTSVPSSELRAPAGAPGHVLPASVAGSGGPSRRAPDPVRAAEHAEAGMTGARPALPRRPAPTAPEPAQISRPFTSPGASAVTAGLAESLFSSSHHPDSTTAPPTSQELS